MTFTEGLATPKRRMNDCIKKYKFRVEWAVKHGHMTQQELDDCVVYFDRLNSRRRAREKALLVERLLKLDATMAAAKAYANIADHWGRIHWANMQALLNNGTIQPLQPYAEMRAEADAAAEAAREAVYVAAGKK